MARPENRSEARALSLTLPLETFNYLALLATLGKLGRTENEVATHILVREVSSGGGTRHVVLVEGITKFASEQAVVLAVHSAGSRNGLTVEPAILQKLSGKARDSYGALNWELAGYHSFHCIVGPK